MNKTTPEVFLTTIYLGDRACKGVLIDAWGGKVKLLVDTISRVRGEIGEWNYYTAEDIDDGSIVFDGVLAVRFDPPGPLPNDFINSVDVRKSTTEVDLYEFLISVSSVDDAGDSREVIITIRATDCYLEDPRRPGVKVR